MATGGLDASETLVAGVGHIYVADVGTTAPTDLAEPGSGWHDLGYTTEDGATFSYSPSVENLNAWQSFYPIRRIITEIEAQVSFTLLQINDPEAFIFAFGGGAEEETDVESGVFQYTPAAPGTLDERAMLLDVIDGDVMQRFVVPRGLQAGNVEAQFVRTDMANLPIEFGVLGTGDADPWYRLRGDVPGSE